MSKVATCVACPSSTAPIALDVAARLVTTRVSRSVL
jgi:hypothetical protein